MVWFGKIIIAISKFINKVQQTFKNYNRQIRFQL